MSYQDIFGSSTDSDASFEGFNVTEMTKTKKASSGKQPQKQSGAGFFPEQVPTEPRAERATSQDGGDADGGPDRSTSGSDPALPPVHMDPTPQMRETPSLGISDDLSRRFVRLESLVEMIVVHVGLVEPEDPATIPEDLSAAFEPAIPVGDEDEHVHENEATPSMPPRKKRKLAESSGSEPDRVEDNDIFFLPPRSSPKTFPVDDSISKYVSSCFYTYLKDDDFNKVTESDLKHDIDFFQAPIVNSTIKDKISDPGVLRGDSFIFKFQSQLISGANGILNLWQHIKDSKDLSHADVLKTLQRSLVLIGSSFAGLSSFRRYRFKSSFTSVPATQELFSSLEPDDTFLTVQRSTFAVGKIYNDLFANSRSDFISELSELCCVAELRYVCDMVFCIVKRKLGQSNLGSLIERRSGANVKDNLLKDIYNLYSLGEKSIDALPKNMIRSDTRFCSQEVQTDTCLSNTLFATKSAGKVRH